MYISEVETPNRFLLMIGEKNERWMKLCEQAAVEQDPQRLLELVREIVFLLDEKKKRHGISEEEPRGFGPS